MNTIGIALVWCVLQVTLVGLLSAGLYLGVRRLRPAAAAPVALTGLLVIVLLSALAMSPWPRWSLDRLAAATTAAPRPEVPPAVAAEGALGATPAGDPVPSLAAEGHQRPSAERPSLGALFWRALADELARSQPGAATASWRWPAVVAIVFLAGVAGGLAWLGLGLWAVRSHRARSQPVKDPALLELVDVLCAELGCRRPIEVRQSDELVSAATLGWRRPVILLPAEWTGWTGPQRRAVLAHEIVHVCRSDFLAVVLGQLGVVLHFYHPLVHWLMGRLRLEQELAADAAAASLSGGQRPYLAMIAELALRQQDRPLAWPARSFLPTRNAFLRRIDVLRNSKVRLDRLSPATRMLAVGAVVVCGLLAAGLRGPGDVPTALADGAKEPSSAPAGGSAEADAPSDFVDPTFFTESAATIVAIRPAAMFARPDLSELARLLEGTGNVVPKGTRPGDFRQITMILPGPGEGPRTGPREVLACQWIKPVAATWLMPRVQEHAVKEYRGKKMYVASPGPGDVVLQYDEQTIVSAGSEQAMAAYLAGRRGVLPKWLPAKAWQSFRGDHLVLAAEGAAMRREMLVVGERAPPIVRAASLPFAPLWEDTAWIAAGARLDDKLAIHAWLEAKDPEAAVKVQRTAEALKTLAQTAAKNVRAQLPADGQAEASPAVSLLETADRMLDAMQIRREGASVRVEAATEVKVAPLAMGVEAARSAAERTRSTNNLKQIALAMHNYHDRTGRLPPAVLLGPDGKTPYSWRVALLPLLEQNDLYEQYRFDEPWDGPNNRKLLTQRPSVYGSPKEPDKTRASYFVLVGPGTVFEAAPRPINFADIVDGTSSTLMIVEAQRDIPWTRPEDIPYDPTQPLPKLGGYLVDKAFLAAFCDGSAHVVAHTVDEEVLRSLIERNDGRKVPPEKIRPSR